MTPTRPLDAALVAIRERNDSTNVTINEMRAIFDAVRDRNTLLEMLAHQDAQLAEAERGIDWLTSHNDSLSLECGKMASRLEAAERQLDAVRTLVDQQAEDPGLWFQAATAPEAYLQQELRRLHERVESKTLADPSRVAPVDRLSEDQRQQVEYIRKAPHHDNYEGELLDILDDVCPRLEPEGEAK